MNRLLAIWMVVCLASCSTTEELTYQDDIGTTFTYHGKKNIISIQDLPVDNAYMQALLKEGYDESCAESCAYSANDIILERKLPSGCHKQYMKFRYVEAYYREDTLCMAFTTRKPGIGKQSSKMLIVKTYQDEVEASLIHGCTPERTVYKSDGTYYTEKTPASIMLKKKMKISIEQAADYAYVVGELDFNGHLLGAYGEKTQEHIHGCFRSRIVPKNMDCKDLLCSM